MPAIRVLVAGVLAGFATTLTGYWITGRLFHRYQAETPGTWRRVESWSQYGYSTAIRLAACIGIALVYAAFGPPLIVANAPSNGIVFGLVIWAVTALPLILEAALFVNWSRGFVVGLLLDWLVLCVLASVSGALAVTAP
jgi:hypothetical protein